MSGSPKNPYAKIFPTNSSLHSLSKRNSPTRKIQESFKIVTDIRGGDIIDLDKPQKHGDHVKGSHKAKKLDKGREHTKDLIKSEREKRRLTEDFEDCEVTKKVRHDRHECYELEEVNDTGQCSDGSGGEDAVETSDEDKVDEIISEDMETFNDLSETIHTSDLLTSDKWMAKVVAHDHDYYGPRVRFRDVTVWYFARHQYSASVPSQGDVAMGMEMKHIHREQLSMDHIDQLSDNPLLCKNKSKRKPRLGGRMKPLSLTARVSLLRSHGILQIDRRESANIEKLQISRAKESGCDCVGACLPETCSCIKNQVECEVESEGFPCKCSHKDCSNPLGRRFFNRKEVDMYRWSQVDANTSNSDLSLSSSKLDDYR